jgi:hypothetical protein
MTAWPARELESIGAAEEIGLASRRTDGSLRPYVTMWVVRAGDGLYVRSAYGPGNPWYRRAVASGAGRIRAGGAPGGPGGPGPHRRGLPRQVRPLRAADRRLGHRPRLA